jgi:hypothetical protein
LPFFPPLLSFWLGWSLTDVADAVGAVVASSSATDPSAGSVGVDGVVSSFFFAFAPSSFCGALLCFFGCSATTKRNG